MMLAGLNVADRHVIELARMLRDAGSDTAARLESGYEHQARLLGLSTAERDEILAVLVDCPDGSASSGPCSFSSTSGASAKG